MCTENADAGNMQASICPISKFYHTRAHIYTHTTHTHTQAHTRTHTHTHAHNETHSVWWFILKTKIPYSLSMVKTKRDKTDVSAFCQNITNYFNLLSRCGVGLWDNVFFRPETMTIILFRLRHGNSQSRAQPLCFVRQNSAQMLCPIESKRKSYQISLSLPPNADSAYCMQDCQQRVRTSPFMARVLYELNT